MTIYRRLKHGEASFTQVELFNDVNKAANPSAKGKFVEIKVDTIRYNFSKVKKENDEDKDTFAKVQGSSGKETPEVPGSKAKSK
tara:strand:- start:174 stop:425 length:252 start_codon:yes stop_codon:yes gene_type:complete